MFCSACCARVACKTFRVVGRRFLIQLFMRVVAGDALEPGVALRIAPALAVFQSIGLKAHVHHAAQFLFAEDDVGPGAVARAAEIDGRDRIELFRIENGGVAGFDFSRFHCGDVIGSGAVAGFALDAGGEMRRVEMAADI